MSLDTLLGIAGVVLGALGLAAAYIFYRKSIRTKEPMYWMRSENLIRDNISTITGLRILYNNESIVNLTSTNVAFWNRGAETIDSRDRVVSNPLRIGTSQNIKILDAKIILENNPSSRMHISLEADGSSAYILFDYLDKGHGCIIKVLHTGLDSSDLSLNGDIKGARLEKVKPRGRMLQFISTIVILIITIAIFALLPTGNISGLDLLAIAGLILSMLTTLSDLGRFKRFSSPLPKALHQAWYD